MSLAMSAKKSCRVWRAVAGLIVLALSAPLLWSQDTGPNERQNIVDFLNQSIIWQQQVSAQQQVANEPSDGVFLSQDRDLADQVVRLSFDFARARAQESAASIENQPGEQNPENPESATRSQNLASAAAKADGEVKQWQKEIEDFKQHLATATGRDRARWQSLVADSESEMALKQARADTLHSLLNFSAGAKVKGKRSESLESQIEELAHTVPALATDGKGQNPAPVQPIASSAAKPEGLLALSSQVLSLRKKLQTLDAANELTDTLSNTSQDLRAPLVQKWKELAQRESDLTNEPDAQDPAGIADHRARVQALGAEFKTLAANVVPLGKQAILLDLYQRNVGAWRSTVQVEYSAALKRLIFRLVMLGIVLGIVLAISELWRRATFRYIQDHRRRLQFLLMRRIVVWAVMAVIIALSFASEIGSLATFAGLLTAGLAVALQNVILSVVGYFFLIGKYGVRVGDRVQVAGVTGDIIDIGLVRMNLMEVGGFGSGPRPTGRVVVFPNAVVFQATGLYKQAPGARFVWHEVGLTLAPESDYQEAEKRMLEAVKTVFDEYKEDIEQQHHRMAVALAPLTVASLEPESRVRLAGGVLRVAVRYPVDLANAAEIDDRITRAVLEA
ncbi:MAG TPA: mechanosensitive ion channel family protein, partial [Terriglobales bacterium]|nr:mechanosensitive ion channel family protein [Terriglobales bacterium]